MSENDSKPLKMFVVPAAAGLLSPFLKTTIAREPPGAAI
jgi:hypothetical protein